MVKKDKKEREKEKKSKAKSSKKDINQTSEIIANDFAMFQTLFIRRAAAHQATIPPQAHQLRTPAG